MLHALVVFHALRSAHPHARVGWVVEPAFAGVLEGLPGLDTIVPFARREGAGAWPRMAAAMAVFAPTWVVDAQGNMKSAAVSLCAASARRSGLHKHDWREAAGARALHDWAPATSVEPAHAIDRMLQLARYVGGTEFFPRFDPGLSQAELEGGTRALGLLFSGSPGAHDVILGVSSPGDVRSWPLAHWAELARGLARAGRRVLLISGPDEAPAGRQLEIELAGVPGLHSWIGQRGLRELAAAFGAAGKLGMRFVGVDSGPMHLAVACGLKVVALEGPQSHLRTGPWPPPERDGTPPRHRVLRSDEDLACAPCFARTCRHPEGPVCMGRLAPERVLRALD